MILSITIWIIGALFCMGMLLFSGATTGEKWYMWMLIFFLCISVWPILCGKLVTME